MTIETKRDSTGGYVFDGVRFNAGLMTDSALANHWAEGVGELELFNNAYFGSTRGKPATFLWIEVSDEQRKALRHASVRRRLRRLNEAYLAESNPHHQVLGLDRPFITLVRASRIPQLTNWAYQNGILTR